jgi:tetratricopeptide (TPR) repeat protein
MTLHDLMFAHRYDEVVAESERLLEERPDDPAALGWHADAMLCLGRLPEALEEFRRIEARARAYPHSEREIVAVGTVLWLLGKRDEAIERFRSAVEGIEDGSITLGDDAGGVSQGLLLWYAGVTRSNEDARERAVRYLRGRTKRAAIKHWPGPLALFVLGRASRDDVLVGACGTQDPVEAVRAARANVLKRRQLVNALFCLATKRREEGSERDCLALMEQCASLENPIVEMEWYLARGEVQQANQQET